MIFDFRFYDFLFIVSCVFVQCSDRHELVISLFSAVTHRCTSMSNVNHQQYLLSNGSHSHNFKYRSICEIVRNDERTPHTYIPTILTDK